VLLGIERFTAAIVRAQCAAEMNPFVWHDAGLTTLVAQCVPQIVRVAMVDLLLVTGCQVPGHKNEEHKRDKFVNGYTTSSFKYGARTFGASRCARRETC
jgi:hypothetical protein